MSKPIYININSNEEDSFLKSNKELLENLKKCYDLFKEDSKKFNDNWEKYKKNHYFHLVPEKNKYLSPITIIDGNWGSGKTFFIESLIKNCIDKKINIEKTYNFKRILVVDLWEYISNDNMINDIVYDVYNKLLPHSKALQNLIKKISKNSLKIGSVLLANIFTNGYLGLSISFKNKTNSDIKKIRKDLEKIDSTILIFDNIERLNNDAIEIIKLVQKICCIDNLLILFVMNKKILEEQINVSFEKYITLGKYFIFEQDYYSLLCNKGIKSNFSKEINLFINELSKKQTLTIRDLDKIIISSKNEVVSSINEACNYNIFYGLKYFNNNVLLCNHEEIDKWILEKLTAYINNIWSHIYHFIIKYGELNSKIPLSFYQNDLISNEVKNIIKTFYCYRYINIKDDFEYLYKNFLKFLNEKNIITNHINLFDDLYNKWKDKNKEIANIFENILKKLTQIDNYFKEMINNIKNDKNICNIFKNLYNNKKLNLECIGWYNNALEPFLDHALNEFIFKLIVNKEFIDYEK